MNTALVQIPRRGALTRADKGRLSLFVKTVGKELVGSEIDEAIEWCEIYSANPFTKDIYFFVFGAPGSKERRVVPVLSIGLYRKNAARSNDYRPDAAPPRFTYDETAVGPDNPKGIVSCEVTLYRHSHGEWHPQTSRLSWEERAPIIEGGSEGFEWIETGETWADSGKPKRKKVPKGEAIRMLDPGKPNWRTMPETMLAKCTEADALRKGWPEALSGSYAEGELDSARMIELTATEIIEEQQRIERKGRVGGMDAVFIDWMDGNALVAVKADELLGKAMDFIKAHTKKGEEEYSTIAGWRTKNQVSLQHYWAAKPAEALELKKALEGVEEQAKKAEHKEQKEKRK